MYRGNWLTHCYTDNLLTEWTEHLLTELVNDWQRDLHADWLTFYWQKPDWLLVWSGCSMTITASVRHRNRWQPISCCFRACGPQGGSTGTRPVRGLQVRHTWRTQLDKGRKWGRAEKRRQRRSFSPWLEDEANFPSFFLSQWATPVTNPLQTGQGFSQTRSRPAPSSVRTVSQIWRL